MTVPSNQVLLGDCRHKPALSLDFPAPVWRCQVCGQDVATAGYVGGVRDYFLPGDPPWRRQAEILKRQWATGRLGESLYQCPDCCFLGTVDDFDCLGADAGNMFCNQCGCEFAGNACDWTRPGSNTPEQLPLFTEAGA